MHCNFRKLIFVFAMAAFSLTALVAQAQYRPDRGDPPGFYYPPRFCPPGSCGTAPQDTGWEYPYDGLLGSLWADWDGVNSPILGSFDELTAKWKSINRSTSCPGSWKIITLGSYMMRGYTTPPATQPPSHDPNQHAWELAQANAAAAAEQAALEAIATATGPNSGIEVDDIVKDVKTSSLKDFIAKFAKTLCPQACTVTVNPPKKPSMKKVSWQRGNETIHSILVRKTLDGGCIEEDKNQQGGEGHEE